MTACLRLLPPDVAEYALDCAGKRPPPPAQRFFTEEVGWVGSGGPGAVGRLACRALFLCLAGPLGGAARAWWGAAPPKASKALERVVQAFVAPMLVRRQLQRVKDRAHELQNATVTVLWSSSEVECVFTVEERPLELRVALGAAHPLSLPAIASPQSGPGAPSPGTAWLAVYLAYQNGSLLHALRMWMAAVSARVGASSQCFVCYCRLHPSTGRLPLVPCRQCRNKFHNECLVRPSLRPPTLRPRSPTKRSLLFAAQVVHDQQQVQLPVVPRDFLALAALAQPRPRPTLGSALRRENECASVRAFVR